MPGGISRLLITSDANDQFNLLNDKGEIEKGFPLKGSIHPVMEELHRNGGEYISRAKA